MSEPRIKTVGELRRALEAYAAEARQAKAWKITRLLSDYGFTREQVSRANEEQWQQIAFCAGVKLPSEATRKLVLDLLGPAPRKPCTHEWPETRRAAHC